ncbi:MAG TPA: hypothetical protein VFV10_09475 [Gammaproteobacteria bacterium]|nr:hypothetical protein [Gammaproteobacteria bacterium]
MSGFKCRALLGMASLVAACASAPERSAENAAPERPAGSAAPAAASTEVAPAKVIDLNAVVDDSASRVTCRPMLRQGSNVIVKKCMTQADWKKYEAWEAKDAQEILRMLQGSGYR